jgi:hypothetical protein
MSAFAAAPASSPVHLQLIAAHKHQPQRLRSEILVRSLLSFLPPFLSLLFPLRSFCFVLLHPMSPSQDGDSTLEPTAGSSRNSLVSHTAAEEQSHSDSTMHAYERAGLPQIPDSNSESEIKRTQATLEPTAESGRNSLVSHTAVGEPANSGSKSRPSVVACMLQFIDGVDDMRVEHTQAADDPQTVEADDHKRADTADYLAWKSAGRPSCQQCLKSHPPPCKSSQEDIDFCQRDPEGYKLYLKSIKPARKQKPRSNRRPGMSGYRSSRVSKPPPALTQAQRLHTLPSYNDPLPTPRTADPILSPYFTALITGLANGTRNDPVRLAGIRRVLAPTAAAEGHALTPAQQARRRALTRVFDNALQSTGDQATADQPEQIDDQAMADQPEQSQA